MAYKSLRNKVLAGDFQVVTSEYKNNIWSGCAYAMYKGDWINDYKLRKDQGIRDVKDMSSAIEWAQGYTDASEGESIEDKEMTLVRFSNKNRESYVQKKFLDFLKAIYPEAKPRLADENSHLFSPVRFYQGGELVAVIMPVKRN